MQTKYVPTFFGGPLLPLSLSEPIGDFVRNFGVQTV